MTKILKTGQRPGLLKISVLRLPACLEFRYLWQSYLDLEFPQSYCSTASHQSLG